MLRMLGLITLVYLVYRYMIRPMLAPPARTDQDWQRTDRQHGRRPQEPGDQDYSDYEEIK